MTQKIKYANLIDYFESFKSHFDEAADICGMTAKPVQNEFYNYNIPEQREQACGDTWKHSTFTKDGRDIETYSKWLKMPFECSGIISSNVCKEDWFLVQAWREKDVGDNWNTAVYSFELYNVQGAHQGTLAYEDPGYCPWWCVLEDRMTVYAGNNEDLLLKGLKTVLNYSS